MNESCPKCGGSLIGDGYTSVVHCEYVEDTEGYEPDAGPVFCEELMKDDELLDVDIENLKHGLKGIICACDGDASECWERITFEQFNLTERRKV